MGVCVCASRNAREQCEQGDATENMLNWKWTLVFRGVAGLCFRPSHIFHNFARDAQVWGRDEMTFAASHPNWILMFIIFKLRISSGCWMCWYILAIGVGVVRHEIHVCALHLRWSSGPRVPAYACIYNMRMNDECSRIKIIHIILGSARRRPNQNATEMWI